MEFTIDISKGMKAFRREMTDFQKRQLPFATATALNNVGKGMVADIKAGMRSAFDRPTPYTLNAFYLKPATKADLVAGIRVREFAGKGGAAADYLETQVFGGSRRQKRSEARISGISGMPFAVPGRGVELDQYGNISRGQIVRILSQLKLFSDTQQNEGARGRGRRLKTGGTTYFVMRKGGTKGSGNGQPIGIFARTGNSPPKAVMIFKPSAPAYQPRFPYFEIVKRSARKRIPGAMDRAFAQAMRTAR